MSTVLPQLDNPMGTKTCSYNQKLDKQTNIHEIDKHSYFVFTNDLTLRRSLVNCSQIVILSSVDKTVRLPLVVMLAICKIFINH